MTCLETDTQGCASGSNPEKHRATQHGCSDTGDRQLTVHVQFVQDNELLLQHNAAYKNVSDYCSTVQEWHYILVVQADCLCQVGAVNKLLWQHNVAYGINKLLWQRSSICSSYKLTVCVKLIQSVSYSGSKLLWQDEIRFQCLFSPVHSFVKTLAAQFGMAAYAPGNALVTSPDLGPPAACHATASPM